MTESRAQDLVNSAALVVAAVYFYRKLIEPATGENAAASSAGTGATPAAGFISFDQPTTLPGAAAQLLGKGKPASTERFVVGWGFVFLTLSLAVPVAPEFAGAFASLAALGSILGNGTQVAKDLETQLHHEAKPGSSTQTATPTTTVAFAGASPSSAVMPQAAPTTPKRARRKKTLKIPIQSA